VNCEEERIELQKHGDKLMEWAEGWMKQFNAEKCEVIQFGSKNMERQKK